MRASPIRQKRNCTLNNLAFVQCTVTVYRANSFSIGYDRTLLCVLNQVAMLKAIIVVCILDYMALLHENVLMWNRRGSLFHSLSPIRYSQIALNGLQS